jgi:ParB family chromosome partitioning protein
MRIKLSSVHDSPYRLRDIVKDEAFYELVDSLRERGLLQPIKVRPLNSGYEIVYGHRRAAAMRHLGWPECEAIVEHVDDEQVILQAVTENIHRKDLTLFEEAQIYASFREQGYTINQIAETVSKSKGYVSNRLSLLRLPPEVQEIVEPGSNQPVAMTVRGTISVDSASRIAAAAVEPAEAIQVARKAVEERLTREEIRELTARLKQAQAPEERQRVIEEPFYPILTTTSALASRVPSPKPFHTAERPISEQFHAKWIWNLKRIDLGRFSHFTIGYSQRNWAQVEELLRLARVTLLVDARRNAVSQYKPEFSKVNLETAVESAGIDYRHIPELGIGSEERLDLAATQDYERLFAAYDRRLSAELLVDVIDEELETERIAFLCVEIDPQTCHRHRIALLLEEMGYLTLDL